MRWSVGRSHFPSWAEGPSCETGGLPERIIIMYTKNSNFNRNTELCVDLKTILISDRRAKMRKDYTGVLTRDGREHFTFIETVPQAPCRRNLRVFDGKYITITRRSDGSLWPNFKAMRLGAGLSVEHYAFEVYRELLGALKGLVEENEEMKE